MTAPTQPVNKILFKSWNQEASANPVASSRELQSASPSVIRVVTNMGGGIKYQREPPKVFTVLSTNQTQTPNLPLTKQYVLQAGGNIQQVPPRNDDNSHLSANNSQIAEGGNGFLEHERSKPNSYTVYTISGNHVSTTSSTKPRCIVPPIARERPSLPANCGPTSKPPVLYTWTDGMTSSGGGDGLVGGHQVTNGFSHLPSGSSHLPPSSFPTSKEQAR